MKTAKFLIGFGVLLVLLAFSTSLSLAKEEPASGIASPLAGPPMTDSFSYQGYLTDNGQPASGTYDFRLTIWDAEDPAASTQVSSCQSLDDQIVTGGKFTILCLPGDAMNEVFTGAGRWLQVEVKRDADAAYTTLPRQPITAAPYAWGLRPGAVISNEASDQHALEVRSNATSSAGTSLWVVNDNATSGIALWATAYGSDTTVIASNHGSGALFKGFGGNGGEHEFIVTNEGDVQQSLEADGLVKAAVFTSCGGSGDVPPHNAFNSISDEIVVTGAGSGICYIDFGFDLSARYFTALGVGTTARGVSCSRNPIDPQQLRCFRWSELGSGITGDIMVVAY
ncbi:MAG: hypothetical protein JW726_04385 [Anaerolineales bacterium]|nr:hypothetical protein [Anaerolineales bacterium]